MAKMYFKYGTMNASKSMDLLRTAYNYEAADKKVLCLISGIDTRSAGKIKSRALKEEREAITITENMDLFNDLFTELVKCNVVLVDECQFLTKQNILDLRRVVDEIEIPVIMWGLKSNYLMDLFEGSREALIHSDVIEEIKAICYKCGRKKATYNILFNNGKMVKNSTEGDGVVIGDKEFMSVCSKCLSKIQKEGTSER